MNDDGSIYDASIPTKTRLINLMKEEFARWEELLAGLSEERLTDPMPSGLSVKDVVAHLLAWQQRSIARLEAAMLHRTPEFPNWPEGLDPEADDVDQINAWIYETYHPRPWHSVHRDWKEGFQRLLKLAETLPEADLLEVGKYAWLPGYALADVLTGWYEHHHEEHLGPLQAWLEEG
jgi:hypothetical protein